MSSVSTVMSPTVFLIKKKRKSFLFENEKSLTVDAIISVSEQKQAVNQICNECSSIVKIPKLFLAFILKSKVVFSVYACLVVHLWVLRIKKKAT